VSTARDAGFPSLQTAISTRLDFASVMWDLRDHAYDHPEQWASSQAAAYAEALFQGLAQLAEDSPNPEDHPSWSEFAALVHQAAQQACLTVSRRTTQSGQI
jgi:hypothetical protein